MPVLVLGQRDYQNYAYVIIDVGTKECAVVDPVDPEKLMGVAKQRGLKITHVLTTHHHFDHQGGNEDMAQAAKLGRNGVFKADQKPKLIVVGGKNDNVLACTHPVVGGEKLRIGSQVEVEILDTPCHTPGHVSFLAYDISKDKQDQDMALFTGDTLFVGGCGNFNDGTPAQMHHALVDVYATLPPNTLVYVGHNYTAKNLAFAQVVEPENQKIEEKLRLAKEQDRKGEYTVPSTIQEELDTNPFVRCTQAVVQEYVAKEQPSIKDIADEVERQVQTLFHVRKAKDIWGRAANI